jgi:hypothetical protein
MSKTRKCLEYRRIIKPGQTELNFELPTFSYDKEADVLYISFFPR